MTKLVVFCDGTWNDPNNKETTSVHELSEAVEKTAEQDVVYFPGIGTNEAFDTRLQAFFRRWAGGAFGIGLNDKVKEAYQWICERYKSGDEIYLFGFSRGAYTARSVAGMLRKCGIAEDTSPAGINAAFKLYRKPGQRNHPDEPHILTERKAISPKFGTSGDDLTWRGDGSELVQIAYMGVFDTVGARGIPPAILGDVARIWNLQYRFHDAVLSSLVQSARHAIAVDERRKIYRPARWDNITKLNKGKTIDEPLRPYQQCWFVGDHGVVGGSKEEATALSVYPLAWVFQGAGLALRLGAGPKASDGNMQIKTWMPDDSTGWLEGPRDAPGEGDSIHPTVKERVLGDPTYRPETLRREIKQWLG